MAINSQRLLPGSSGGALAKYSNKQIQLITGDSKYLKKNSAKIKKEDSLKKDLVIIKTKVISIDKLLKTNLLIGKKSLDLKTKNEKVQKSLKREKKLEEKPKGKGGMRMPSISLPATGFLDSIKRFLFWMVLGRLFFTYFNSENLNKLTGTFRTIGKVMDFVEGTFSTVLSSLVNFIDFSYTKYDEVRSLAKKVGGKKGTEIFDKFSKELNTFINSAIIIGILLSKGKNIPGLPGRKGGIPRGGTPKGGTPKPNVNLRNYLGRDAQSKLIERRYGNNAARIYENARANGKTAQQARAAVQKAINSGRIVAQEAGEGLAQRGGSNLLKRGVRNAPGRLMTRALGRGGVKGAIRGISKGFGRIPLIGPIVDFLVSVFVFKEKPGRAAAGAVGNAVGTAVGGFLGTFIPFPGVGTWLGATGGGILGDILGRSLYDATIGANSKEEVIQTKAAGGVITRGGQYQKKGTRTLSISKQNAPKRITPQKTVPGKDVGGLQQIEKLYPNPKPEENKPNALEALKKTSETLKKTKFVGALMGASVDIALGQKPSKKVYETIGNNIAYLVTESADRQAAMSMSNLTRAIAAMADGGAVPSGSTQILTPQAQGEILSRAISNTIESNVNEALKVVKREVLARAVGREEMLQQNQRRGASGAPGGGGDFTDIDKIEMGGLSADDIDALGRMVAAEAGNQSKLGKAGVLSVILNRYRLAKAGKGYLPSGKNKDNVTLRDILYAPNEFSSISDGRFDATSSAAGKNALADAIDFGGNDPEKLKQKLIKDLKLSESDAETVVRATAFSNPRTRGSRPFDTPEVAVGNHSFQESPNARIGNFPGSISASISRREVEVGKTLFSTDIEAFREFRNKQFGAMKERQPTATGEYYQIRELGIYGSGGYGISPLADDTSYEVGEHKGAGHWENRAFDIPVPESSAEGDRVAKFWQDRGYDVIWRSDGHYDHVHVEVPANKAAEFFKVMKEEDKKENTSDREYDVIIPLDHHTGSVPPKSLWPNASLGASGRERDAQNPTAEIIRKRLEANGLKVKIMRPEDYRTEDAYNKDLVRYSQAGAVVSSLHYDAPRSGGGIGFLARLGKSADQNDRDYANKIAPILQAMARQAGNSEQSYGGIDTAGNITMRLAGPATAALIELGSMVEQEKKYGKEFWKNPQFIKHLNDVADATASSVQQRKPKPVQRPLGTTAVLNNKPVIWDGNKWALKTSSTEKQVQQQAYQQRLKTSNQVAARLKKESEDEEKFRAKRPWFDKFGLLGGAARFNKPDKKSAGGPVGDKYNDLRQYTSYSNGGVPIFMKQTVYVKI